MTTLSRRTQPAGLRNWVIDAADGRAARWADLPAVTYRPPTAAVVGSGYDALPYIARHGATGDELVVVSASRMTADLRADLLEAGFELAGAETAAAPTSRSPEADRLWLLTSGSTGRPKRIGHTLESLCTVRGEQEPRRWLNPYSPGSYAWWQVVTLSWGVVGQDMVTVGAGQLDSWAAAAAEHGVTAASGTPTFWRQSLLSQSEALSRVPLQQVTLGGEPVDQAIIDQLGRIFPSARISWIYASSEVGASIVVHDGRAGFPEEWLGWRSPDRPVIDVDGDELIITSPHHGVGLDGAVRTGDRVERVDGRALITGRIDRDEINVGGNKVSAGRVRDVLQGHPAVAWAQVAGRRAPVVGALVQANVVVASGAVADADLERDLRAWCAARLPEYGVPRRILFKNEIPSKETLKSDV